MKILRAASLWDPVFLVLIKKTVNDYIYNVYDHYSYE